ncbi:MAG TPA: hypothetical protein VFW33_24050 [Gemmataceae bacterium]|nr:hypothetical protein [Gemmataceae bacterium]
MNPLVTLLMAAAATGADPQPVVQQTAGPVASYTYSDTESESRPGFLGRIHNALHSKSSSGPAPLAPSVISTSPTAAPSFVPSGSSAEPPLADTVPVSTPAPTADVRPVTPQPAVISQPTYTQPTYTYPAPASYGTGESNDRVRFPRLRKLFGASPSSSQPYQALPQGYVVTTPQTVTPTAPAPAAPAVPVIRDQPQRMPVGKP